MAETKARKKSRFGADEDPIVVTDPGAITIAPATADSATVSFKVVDPEGFPLTYSGGFKRDSDNVLFTGQSGGLPPVLASPVVITVGGDGTAQYKFVSRTAESDGSGYTTTDAYKYRFIATDGINTVSSTKAFALSFATAFTFDTSSSVINAYGDNVNKLIVYASAGTAAATSSQIGKMGKGYMEYKIIADTSYPMMGVVTGSTSGGYGTGTSIFLYHDGTYYGGGSATGLGASATNDIIMIAYDTAASQVWLGMNGSWGNKNPASDAGYSITGGANGFRPAFHYGGGGASAYTIEIISHTTAPQYTIPTGWALA